MKWESMSKKDKVNAIWQMACEVAFIRMVEWKPDDPDDEQNAEDFINERIGSFLNHYEVPDLERDRIITAIEEEAKR